MSGFEDYINAEVVRLREEAAREKERMSAWVINLARRERNELIRNSVAAKVAHEFLTRAREAGLRPNYTHKEVHRSSGGAVGEGAQQYREVPMFSTRSGLPRPGLIGDYAIDAEEGTLYCATTAASESGGHGAASEVYSTCSLRKVPPHRMRVIDPRELTPEEAEEHERYKDQCMKEWAALYVALSE